MTTPPPPDPDEQAAALLDGELSPDEAAAARRDPRVRRRLEAQAAARDALREADRDAVLRPGPERADAAIAAALAAFDAEGRALGDGGNEGDGEGAAAATDGRGAAGDEIEHRRRGRARRSRWLSAAAGIVLLAGAAAAVARLSSDDDDQTASVADSPEAADEEVGARSQPNGAGTAGTAPGSGGDDTSAAAPESARTDDAGSADAPPVDLGTLRSVDEVVAHAVGLAGGAADRTTASGTPGPLEGSTLGDARCRPDRSPVDGPTPPDAQATATLAGRALDVWVHRDAGGTRVVAVDQRCTVVIDRTVDG